MAEKAQKTGKNGSKPQKTVGLDPTMMADTEKMLRGALKDVETQQKLLRAKQEHVKVWDEELADQASKLGRTAALVSAEIRKFERQDVEFALSMGEGDEFDLALEWAASLSKDRLTELHKAVGKLLKEDRGLL